MKRTLFVTGPSRSGTTLLRLILSVHPKISISPEAGFIQEIIKYRWNPESILKENKKNLCVQFMKKDKKLKNWPDFNLANFLEFINNNENLTLRKMLTHLFDSFNKEKNAEIIGNKKGIYSSVYGKYIKKIFPKAKIIFISRDPRDVIRSQIENLSTESILSSSLKYVTKHKNFFDMSSEFTKDTFLVKYEALLRTTDNICKKMCDFLDINYSHEMTNFEQTAEKKLIIYTKKIHHNTLRPPDTSKIGQWKSYKQFSNDDIAKIEYITDDVMKRMNYKERLKQSISKKLCWLNLFYYFHDFRMFLRKFSHLKNRFLLKLSIDS